MRTAALGSVVIVLATGACGDQPLPICEAGTCSTYLELPPDQQMHELAVQQCARLGEGWASVVFEWATNDEPWSTGEVDVEPAGCDRVRLRGTSAADGNGRVYTLGWSARHLQGVQIYGSCEVMVKTGAAEAHDDGANYGIDFDPSCRP